MWVCLCEYKGNSSIIQCILADACFPDDLVCVGRTVFCVEVAEVGALAVVVDHVGQVDGIAHQSSGVHEVSCYFQTAQQGHLCYEFITTKGAIRLRLWV